MSVSGVLVIDKPKGPTSHDVVARLRRLLRTRQVGHAGTLDPMASGVLVVAVGEATKLVPWLTAADKAYEATLRLGVLTDTLDAEGRVVDEQPIAEPLAHAVADLAAGRSSTLVASAVASERAREEQIPPAFSAIRVGGERAHELARRGEAPELEARAVAVRALDVVGAELDPARIDLALAVSKGYFVRSLARDLAEALGSIGHLTALRRTRSGPFTIAEAVPIEKASVDALLPLSVAAARALPASVLDDDGVRAARCGQKVGASHLAPARSEPSAWLDASGKLIAIGELSAEGHGQVLRGFVP